MQSTTLLTLTLTLTLSMGKTVNYLDMTIWHDANQWQSKLYDTKAELINKGLEINKFPHAPSMITTKCKYGVITSQLHRYSQACTKTKFFMEAATDLYGIFIKKGYQKQKVQDKQKMKGI